MLIDGGGGGGGGGGGTSTATCTLSYCLTCLTDATCQTCDQANGYFLNPNDQTMLCLQCSLLYYL
jgi:hypothetical protein